MIVPGKQSTTIRCTTCGLKRPISRFIAGGKVSKCLDCILRASLRARQERERRNKASRGI